MANHLEAVATFPFSIYNLHTSYVLVLFYS